MHPPPLIKSAEFQNWEYSQEGRFSSPTEKREEKKRHKELVEGKKAELDEMIGRCFYSLKGNEVCKLCQQQSSPLGKRTPPRPSTIQREDTREWTTGGANQQPGVFTTIEANFTGLPTATGGKKKGVKWAPPQPAPPPLTTTKERTGGANQQPQQKPVPTAVKTIDFLSMNGPRFVSAQKGSEKCKLCQQEVALADKRNHAAETHLVATLECPVGGCDFETMGSLFDSVEMFNRHKVGGFDRL